MPAHYATSLATTRLQAVIDAIGNAGKLVIGTSALSGATGVLATFTLGTPNSTVAARVLTVSGVPLTAVASAGGVAAKAEFRTSADATIVDQLTVGLAGSGCDIIVDSTGLVSGRTSFLLAATITHP